MERFEDSPALRPRADAPTVILHWCLVAALGVSLATGFRIAADAPDAVVGRLLSPVLFQGNVIFWHVVSATVLVGLAAAYVIFL